MKELEIENSRLKQLSSDGDLSVLQDELNRVSLLRYWFLVKYFEEQIVWKNLNL